MGQSLTPFHNLSSAKLSYRLDEYFAKCKKRKTPPSMTGLALHLNVSRQVLVDYSKTDEYSKLLERAKLMCENVLEERMINGTPPTGIIFILKNNYGWNDKVQVDQTIKGTINLSALFDRAADQRQLTGTKTEIVEGDVQETLAEELVFEHANKKIKEDVVSNTGSDSSSGEESRASRKTVPSGSNLPDELF
jgi:hypothetical protein